MPQQLALFAARSATFDSAFARVRHHVLEHGAWLDHVPAWVSGDQLLFDQLKASLHWKTEARAMYGQEVTTPRLLATVPHTGIVEEMPIAISRHYKEDFVRTTAALYRDGSDSVAYHGDTHGRDMDEALVATVSLGAPRRMLLRPTAS